MLHKTRGVIIHTINYSETSLIAKVFTREFGFQSYMIKGVRSKKSKIKANLFQPLTLVDMVVTHSWGNKLQRISEINVSPPYSEIPYNIIKSSITLFLNEIIYKALQEGHPDENMFDFIENSLQILDLKHDNCSNFHVFFMIQLSRYLGFYPQGNHSEQTPFFDLKEGYFINRAPLHSFYLSNRQSASLNQFIIASYESIHLIRLDKIERKELLNAIIVFYQLHIESFKEIKSQEILQEVIE